MSGGDVSARPSRDSLHRLAWFLAGGVVLQVVPNVIAVVLHEMNMRKQTW